MKRSLVWLALAAAPLAAQAQETTLRVVSAFAENTTYVKNLMPMIEKLNAEGKGRLQLNFIGGPKAMPPFDDIGRARQIASDSPDQEARRAMLAQIDRQQVRMSMDAERLALLQQDLGRLRRDEERIPLLLSAASSIGGTDRKAALELLNQAAEIVNSTKSARTQLEGQLHLAAVHCSLNSDRGFTIMESLVPRLNELVAAATTLGGLENNYFSDGEWNMSSGGPVGALLTRLAHNAGSFARMDFDRSVALANQFERYEIRLMAQLKLAQSVLQGQPKPTLIYQRPFRLIN